MLDYKNNEKAGIKSSGYKPNKQKVKALRRVYDRYTDFKNYRQHPWGGNLESMWKQWYQQYESWRPPKSFEDWQSNIVPPFTTTIVEKSVAEIVGQTLRPDVVEQGPEDAVAAKIVDKAIDYTWEIGDGDIELYKAIKQALILGKTVWQEYYFVDKRHVKMMTKFNFDTNEEEYEEKEIAEFDDVYGETVPLEDFFIDSETINRGANKAPDCIRRYVMSEAAFKSRIKGSIWDQFGDAKYVRAGAKSDFYQFYDPIQNYEDKVEMLMYWSRYPDDKLIIVANDVVIRDGPNPYNHKQLPFAEGTDVKRVRGFYGIGQPELLQSIQDELTTIRRMRIDRQHLDIFKTFVTSDRDMLDEDENFVAPNRFIQSSDPGSFKALEHRDINPSAYREEELLKDDGRKVTGIESPGQANTATEAAIFREVTMKALQLKIWLLSKELLSDIARLRASNIVQFWSVPKSIQVVDSKLIEEYRQIQTTDYAIEITRDGKVVEKPSKGENFFKIDPALIIPSRGGFNFRFSAEPTLPISKTLRQSKFLEMLNTPAAQIAINSGYWDPGKVADMLAETHDFSPEDFKSAQSMDQGQEQQPPISPEKLIQLAEEEFNMIIKGVDVTGTAYAPFAHTQIHLAQMDSEAFKQAVQRDPRVGEIMTKHIMEEITGQRERAAGSEGGMPGGMPQPGAQNSVAQGIMSGEAKAANPERVLGAENVPGAQVINPTRPF